MKNLLLIMMTCCIAKECGAQIFAQKKTKRELLLQQIVALQVYVGYLQKGYTVVKDGINAINNIKEGDFDLHNVFFNSFDKVNPVILSYSKVPAIAGFAYSIEKLCIEAISSIGFDSNLTGAEKSYLEKVLTSLRSKTVITINELTMVTTDELLEMKDDERIKWIDRIYDDIKDKYVFVQSFCKDAQVLSAQRSNNAKEINSSKVLNGLR